MKEVWYMKRKYVSPRSRAVVVRSTSMVCASPRLGWGDSPNDNQANQFSKYRLDCMPDDECDDWEDY